jgi:hypothetical protein
MRPFNCSSGFTSLVLCLIVLGSVSSDALSQSAPGSSYSVVSQPQAVQGSYSPQKLATGKTSQETIGPTRSGPSNGVPGWVLNHLKDFSVADSLKVQRLYMEHDDLKQQLQNPGSDAVQTITDVVQAGVTGSADSPPIQEERHQQRVRMGEIEDQLKQIFADNNVLASPFVDDPASQPSEQNANPKFGTNGDFSIGNSDSTPIGFSGQAEPFDWQSGWQKKWLPDLPPSFDSSGPADSGLQTSSGGIVIDSRVVSDPSALANGITVETGFVSDPSSDGIEKVAPSANAPISITTGFVTENPSPAVPSGTWNPSVQAASPHQSFWEKYGDAITTGLQIAGQVTESIEQSKQFTQNARRGPAASLPATNARASSRPVCGDGGFSACLGPDKACHSSCQPVKIGELPDGVPVLSPDLACLAGCDNQTNQCYAAAKARVKACFAAGGTL